jgi:dihydrofolate reductase
MSVVVVNHLTLDGVVRAPAAADEDTRNGFTHGGWSVPYGNPTLLKGDAADAIAELSSTTDENLTILGSATLVQALLARNLIDELVLMIHPLILGSGRRLFSDHGTHASFGLIDSLPTTTGVQIATYRRRS